ncbi:hypothetical protein FSP39_015755 [Pinctada imbricata]|uniref:Uncharacterized protein n=1 Tax=Pinctada imbricata TaxID=66713 RepID=A0AA89BXG9_PINIB|nr:hypothetical protein FSP39_015755 [Pinctada imbricata]
MSTARDDDKGTEEDQSEYNKVKWARSRQRFTRSSTITHEVTERPKTRGREPIRTDSVLNGYIVSRVNLNEPDCSNNVTVYEEGILPRCPSSVGQSAAPYFRGLFILLVVILLLNILLVMLIDSFKKVQEESYMHWLKTFRGVIEEYRAKAFLPPPYAVLFLFVGVIFLTAWLIAIPIRMCHRARSKRVADKKRSESRKKLTDKNKSTNNNVNNVNHTNDKSMTNSAKESQDGDLTIENMDDSTESEEGRAPNFYEGMEVFMKIFAAMTYKEKKIERDIVRKFEKEMKQQYVKRITPVTQAEESDVLRDQVDRTEVLERLLSEQDRALKRLEKRTARIEDDLDEMDKWMDGVDKTLAIYRGTTSSAGSRRSRAKSRQGSRPVSLGEVKATPGSLTREDTHMKS